MEEKKKGHRCTFFKVSQSALPATCSKLANPTAMDGKLQTFHLDLSRWGGLGILNERSLLFAGDNFVLPAALFC